MGKRWLSLLLAAVLCAALVACGTGGNVDVSQAEQQEAQNEKAKDSLQTLNGVIADASMHSIAVRTEDGQTHIFPIQDTTAVQGEDGLTLGRRVTVTYRGSETQTAQVQEITVMPTSRVDRVEELLAQMTLEEKVGQMFFVRCPESRAEEMIGKYQMGGYILFARDFENETKESIKQTIAGYQKKAKTAMLIGVDEEGGTVTRVSRYKAFRGAPFLSPQALYREGGLALIGSDTKEKAELLLSLGINVNFAPVCDVSTNAKDYMFQRAFGQDAHKTAEYVKTVVSVMKEFQLGSVLKHFPGYGNNLDTHTGIAHDKREYDQFVAGDFLPFQAGIAAGADCVLVSHNIVTCMDPKNPASLSVNVHQILRNELGFQGVMITDDLYMDAIKKYTDNSSAAVLAVEAGNDMLCCTDFEEQIPSVIQAVKNGEISLSRIEESVRRILHWKMNLGLIQ